MSLLDKKRARPLPKYDDKRHIVVTEGVKAEVVYLKRIDDNIKKRFRSKFNIIEIATQNVAGSNPDNRLNELNNRIAELNNQDKKNANFYLISDVDRWGNAQLAGVARECINKSIDFLVSNPCFEIWIILHFLSDEELNNYLNNSNKTAIHLKRKARELSPGYDSPTSINIDELINRMDHAIRSSSSVDDLSKRWPDKFTSRLYVLMQRLEKYFKDRN